MGRVGSKMATAALRKDKGINLKKGLRTEVPWQPQQGAEARRRCYNERCINYRYPGQGSWTSGLDCPACGWSLIYD